jgi:glycosyltransferase involved in cell wall biosynthesis
MSNKDGRTSLRGVCMLINTFYPLPPGGAERQAEQLSTYLSRQNIKVTVITRHVFSLPYYEAKDGYDIVRVPQFGSGKMKTLTFTIGAIVMILAKRRSFDILHAHLVHSPAFAAVIAGKLIGKKTIVMFGSSGLGSHLSESKTSPRTFVRMAVLKRWADRFIVLADAMQNELISEGYERNRIIHMFNGVDTDHYAPQGDKQKARGILENQAGTVLIFTGRLVSVKNLPCLLHALKKVILQCTDLHLVLVGDGVERDLLIDLTNKLGLQSYVTFVGLVSNVRDYLQASDIFILPSFAEGNSNSLLEAMSCGLACISTRVGAAAEVLDNGACGVLVESDNVDQLADSIIRLVLNPVEHKRLGALARQRILDNYSINAIGQNYLALYTQVFNGDNPL